MFLPFDTATWILIVFTLIISLVVIQILNFCSSEIKNFIYGRAIRTPTVNLASIFLCGAQFKFPGRNFARFLLTLFVIWSMIIRTCYQSKYFEYLQSDERKPRMETLKDLIDNNFTMFVFKGLPLPDANESIG